ncbi:MAG: hypothetical protein ABI779_01795 [Acidobacteriota bacterium]
MIAKEEWDAAYRLLLEDGRKRLGPPPTFEEAEALLHGDLAEEEAERVRERLSVYPDLLRALSEPIPSDGGNILSAEELAADLARIRERVRRTPAEATPLPFPQRGSPFRWVALAAGIVLAVAIGTLVLRQRDPQKRGMTTQVLYPEGLRRGEPTEPAITLSSSTDYMLQPVLSSRRQSRAYRFEFLDVTVSPPRRIWRRDDVPQRPDGTFMVPLATGDLEPGPYRLVLYGVDETEQPLASYGVRLLAR